MSLFKHSKVSDLLTNKRIGRYLFIFMHNFILKHKKLVVRYLLQSI